MSSLASLLGKVSETYRALGALLTVFVAGFALAISLYGFTSLPQRMDEIEKSVADLQAVERKVDRILCILTLEPNSNPLQCIQIPPHN